MATTITSIASDHQENNRLEEVKRFDESKLGVKGLVDSGLSSIPRIFIHPTDTLSDLKQVVRSESEIIPTVDLFGVDSNRRPAIVEQISRASRELGFFQIVNHGVPMEIMNRLISGIKAFHEQPAEVKKQWYRRDGVTGVSFLSNFDLFMAKAASWRDTIQVRLGSMLPELHEIPEICRNEVLEWNQQATKVAEMLMELLCEGLGLNAGRLKQMTCLQGWAMAGHYYPHCPQPDLTFGFTSHIDSGVLTLLLQDHIGGLQIKHGEQWVDVKPLPGALVVNIADMLQMLSNDEYKSGEHRVLANNSHDPRISIVTFFNVGNRECLYGPFPELVSPEKPAVYRQFTITDYLRTFLSKEPDGKTLLNFYRM